MPMDEYDRARAKARYARRQLAQKIEALEEFERSGKLSDRRMLLEAYEEEIRMVRESEPELAFARAVWLLGDCLDRIDPENMGIAQLDELYDRACEIAEILAMHSDWRREYDALTDYMKRMKEMMYHRGREGRSWYHAQHFMDDPALEVLFGGDMMRWLETRRADEEEAAAEEGLPQAWGDADALREAWEFYDSFAEVLGWKR